jgi:hypothetical protein
LLLSCVIAAVIVAQTASTENAAWAATKVVDKKKKQVKHSAAPRTKAQTSKPETKAVVPQPEAQEPGPNVAVPSSEEQKSGPDAVAPPSDGQTSKPETKAVVPQPEAQKSSRKATDLAVPQLVLPADVAKAVGQKIWLNESDGSRDAVTSWNANEEFASLGIGHFLWFPAGKTAPFEEDFPLLLEFLREEGTHLPSWLDKTPIPPCPWMNRAEFKKAFNSPVMKQLRQFLLGTVAGQTQFLVARAQRAVGKILENTPDDEEREHIITQLSRVARASNDLYPLIDYINFKGDGTNPAETAVDKQTGNREGWGLKQVLLRMNGTTDDRNAVLAEFADTAQFLLRQRVRNLPANRLWQAGWLHRVDTYRRPIADLESNPKRAGSETPRAKAAKAR